MNPVSFSKVTFSYENTPVLLDWSLEVQPGVTSLIGPNGTGKSTFLLLASGRLVPASGTVLLHGIDTKTLNDDSRNELASLVYQNMEFENEEPLGHLLYYVAGVGFLADKSEQRVREIAEVFELTPVLDRKTQHLSKGELQRAVMAFALLYGSRVVMMDEPVFALEDYQKNRALAFLQEFSVDQGVSVLFSVHELELTRKYSSAVMLFSKSSPPLIGSTAKVLNRENLEWAYQVPAVLLHKKERLYRDSLVTTTQINTGGREI